MKRLRLGIACAIALGSLLSRALLQFFRLDPAQSLDQRILFRVCFFKEVLALLRCRLTASMQLVIATLSLRCCLLSQ